MADHDEPRPEDISDELAKKYDPQRLLKILARRAGRGDPLDHAVRSKYERQFGVDLGHVRVVTGEFAEEFNRQRNAYAVTLGGTGMILMGNSPEKSMGSRAGQALLAHELTHVAQAKRGLHRKAMFDESMPFGEEHDEIEHEAEQVEAQEAQGAGSGAQAVQSHEASLRSEKQREDDLERIRERVLELCAEAARGQLIRNGAPRRY